MSLRELTLEELMLVAGGEGEGNSGDSPDTGSAGAGDGQDNDASGGGIGTGGGMANAGGYGFGPAPPNAQVAGLARDVAVQVGIEAGKALLGYAYDHSSPYGQSQNGKGVSPSLGVSSGPDPVGGTPQDGYGVDGQRSSGPGG